jgi:hypothetical protein
VDEKGNSDSNLAAKAHALCGGSTCWVQVRRCTEICKEAPEILRQVHHLIDVEVRDALQLKHLQSLHTATARLIERAKEFERADSQRAKKKRPPDASET